MLVSSGLFLPPWLGRQAGPVFVRSLDPSFYLVLVGGGELSLSSSLVGEFSREYSPIPLVGRVVCLFT